MSSSDEDINVVITPELLQTLESSGFLDGRKKPKCIRAITVCAYVLCVSMAAILLSVYYVFVWDGQQPRMGARRVMMTENFSESSDVSAARKNCNNSSARSPTASLNLALQQQQHHQITATEMPDLFVSPASATATDENATFPEDVRHQNQKDLDDSQQVASSKFMKKFMSYKNNDVQQFFYGDEDNDNNK